MSPRSATARRGSGEGSVRQLPSGKWEARVTIASEVTYEDGERRVRQQRRKRVVRTKREAVVALQELRGRGAIGSGDMRLSAFLDDWLRDVLPHRTRGGRPLSAATVGNYRTILQTHVIPVIGHLRLVEVTATRVDRLLLDMAQAGKARSTMRLTRLVLSMALDHAEDRNLIPRNEAKRAILPAGPVRESRSMTEEQVRTFLAAAAGDRLEAAWLVMLGVGLRPGEAFALRWEDLDLDAGILHVRQALRRTAGADFVLGEPKTRWSVRTIDLPPSLVSALGRHRERQEVEREQAGTLWEDTGLVFTTAIGTRIDPAKSRRAFRKLTETAGLGAWHPHELRHTATSILSEHGVPIERLGDLIGHRPGSRVTAEVYRHRLRDSVDAAKLPMEQIFNGRD